ncbi:MFS transporter (plasmid) [Nicoliella spurrieriana]|uniref:MFS transporter n=1 Tax=Nicoliella spurrieriana TaxID=2925830 RepID=A0A976X4Q5_9LACO|nr:MFS transporter [Nicoliella spurrieriana]UQS86040.1 MFS transporter [Nicoliella spurrieriana]
MLEVMGKEKELDGVYSKSDVEDLDLRLDNLPTGRTFKKVFWLVLAGMVVRSIDFYLASGVASSLVKSGYASLGQTASLMSASSFGLLVGSLSAGFLGDKLGRRHAYQLNLVFFGVMTMLSAVAPNMTWLIVLRGLSCIGMGAELVTGFSMINEFAPVNKRGRWAVGMTAITCWGSPLGMLMSSLIIPSLGWRVLFIGVGVFALFVWVLRRELPESPRWLFSKGRYAEAEAIVNQMEKDDPNHDKLLDEKRNSNKVQNEMDQADKVTYSSTKLFWRVVITSFVLIVADVCEYTFVNWEPTMLAKSGHGLSQSLGLSTIMMVAAPLGALLGMLLVDRLGRKFNLLLSFIAMVVLGLGYTYQTTSLGLITFGFLLTLFIYVLISTVFGAFIPEMFPTSFRLRGVGLANTFAKGATMVTPFIVVWLLSSFGFKAVLYAMSVLSLLAVLVTIFFVPETKKKHIK